jgi:anti-sigma B factor antagonist
MHALPRPMRPLLEVEVRDDGDSVVVRPTGEIDVATIDTFAGYLLPRCTGRVRVDMAAVRYCGAAGVRVLWQANERSRRHGHQLVLLDPPAAILRVLDLLGLRQAFAVEDSRGRVVEDTPGRALEDSRAR